MYQIRKEIFVDEDSELGRTLGTAFAGQQIPDPVPDPAPGPGLELSQPILLRDKPNAVVSFMKIVGDRDDASLNYCIRAIRCPGIIIEDCDLSFSRYSALWLTDCPGAKILGGDFHDNGRVKTLSNGTKTHVGHGVHLDGDCDGTLIKGLHAFKNWEDGAQQQKSCTGLVTYDGVLFEDNDENAIDGKGGRSLVLRSTLDSGRDECVVLHKNHESLVAEDTLFIARSFKAHINASAATVSLVRPRLRTIPSRPDKYVRMSQTDLYGAEILPDFAQDRLTVSGGSRV